MNIRYPIYEGVYRILTSFSLSKTLNCETKFDFDSEYIGFNSLIYKADDALHRMSSRYIGS